MEKLKEMKPGQFFKQSMEVLLLSSLFFTCLGTMGFKTAADAKLIISLENVRNSKGMIRIAVFNGADGFPEDRDKALRLKSVQAKEGVVKVVLEGLPSGRYAVALLHDENENGKMDTNMVGYPKEGYGVSINNTSALRAPRFDEASFDLRDAQQNLSISIRY